MRILLVDDHADSITCLARLLLAKGHDIRTATTLAEARSVCQAEPFDLMLCDIGLPDGDGWELAEVARRRGTKAIALTGYGMAADIKHSRSAGFSAHVLKPFEFEKLEAAILATCG